MNRETTNNYDSEFCGNLPVHLINVIQNYGALVVADQVSGKIIQVSENAARVFGLPFADLPGRDLLQFLPQIRNNLHSKEKLPQSITINGIKYLGIFHLYEDFFILEINLDHNEAIDGSFIDVFHELKDAMSAIESAGSIHNTLRTAAREIKNASRFDKVMIYRFDENWNGHVLAEAREEDMESYLGLTFPASDIPRPARDLYLRNAYRFIPDRTYTPVKMYPVINPSTNTFLDMSDCNLRGVSTVHLEYLKNMGVTASMSTRILKDGKLWGLIACHHKTTMRMNYKICAVLELLSGLLANRISSLENIEKHSYETSVSGIYTSLLEESYKSSDPFKTLLKDDTNILQLFNAEGAVINHNGHTRKIGIVPEIHDIEDIILWLNTKQSESVYYTNSLGQDYDYAGEFRDVASGMLAIPVDVDNDEYILLFRPEVVRVINWGGDPAGRIQFKEDNKTYHPRNSFRIYQETVTGMSSPWNKMELEIAENLQEFVKAFLNGKEYSYKN